MAFSGQSQDAPQSRPVKDRPASHTSLECLCVFFYFSTGAKDKKLISGHHSARPEEPLHSEADGRRGRRNTRRTGQSNKRARNLRTPQPNSALRTKARLVCIIHPSTSVQGGPAIRPLLRRLRDAQCPSGS